MNRRIIHLCLALILGMVITLFTTGTIRAPESAAGGSPVGQHAAVDAGGAASRQTQVVDDPGYHPYLTGSMLEWALTTTNVDSRAYFYATR